MKKNKFKRELKIAESGETWKEQQIKVTIHPKKKPKSIPAYDCIHLSMRSIHEDQDGAIRDVYLTPDEALDLAIKLSTAAWGFLNFGYGPYDRDFNKPRKKLDKKRTKRLKKKKS